MDAKLQAQVNTGPLHFVAFVARNPATLLDTFY